MVDHQDANKTALVTCCQSLGLRWDSPGGWGAEMVAERVNEPMWF